MAKGGKKLADIDRVPGYWPDNDTIRNDMLDYALEVEHFDRHLGRMLTTLEARRLLENTLVIVTSDHGMPFPRVKGQAYEPSNHIPLAMMWKNGLKQPGRKVDGPRLVRGVAGSGKTLSALGLGNDVSDLTHDRRIAERRINFGTNIKYAGFQQFGTRYIPARPFLPITRSGELTDNAGPAKLVFDRIFQSVGNYIVNGKLVR